MLGPSDLDQGFIPGNPPLPNLSLEPENALKQQAHYSLPTGAGVGEWGDRRCYWAD